MYVNTLWIPYDWSLRGENMDAIVRPNLEHFPDLIQHRLPWPFFFLWIIIIIISLIEKGKALVQKEYTREPNTLKTTAILKTNQIYQIPSVKVRNIYNKPLCLIVEACLEDYAFLNLRTCGWKWRVSWIWWNGRGIPISSLVLPVLFWLINWKGWNWI